MNAEDYLFILYTSGSTGKPKGVVHSTAGYLLWSALTHKYVFDIHEGDVYFCTADIGWVTGHSYVVYGPLCNGGTTSCSRACPRIPMPDASGKSSRSSRSIPFTPRPPPSARSSGSAMNGRPNT
jgi:acetyl-CoA synthetase